MFSGVLGGFFAMSGPPIVAYLLQTSESNDEYMAEVQTYFAITNLFSSFLRAATGIITLSVIRFWGIGIITLALGTILGRFFFKCIDGKKLKFIIYGFMLFSGIINLF